jgi:acyl carrier protein
MALQRKYGVRIGDQNLARSIISSVNNIADFITREKANLNR